MHELAICQALIAEVAAVARSHRAISVTDIYVRVGPLSGVEGPLMRSAFPVAAAGTIATNAILHLQEMIEMKLLLYSVTVVVMSLSAH